MPQAVAMGTDWRRRAACTGMDLEAFFPKRGAATSLKLRAARQACQTCPVRTDCLDWALGQEVMAGIWGGTTERERRRLRQAR
jgi:WhiB family transcriptional regulator, redox-sensing transcriptional regulator